MEHSLQQAALPRNEKQHPVGRKHAAVVGLGALGSVAAELLVRHGIGKLTLIDRDIVEMHNLGRQRLYGERDVGKLKVVAAAEKLACVNRGVALAARAIHLEQGTMHELAEADVVLDCTDNLETRFAINAFCRKMRIPWVHGAAAGAIGVVMPVVDGGYCFACVYAGRRDGLDCDDAGILPMTAQMAAAQQVAEALKILAGEEATNGMIRLDGRDGSRQRYIIRRNPACPVCAGDPAPRTDAARAAGDPSDGGAVRVNGFSFSVAKCSTRAAYSARPSKQVRLDLSAIRKDFETVVETPIVVVIREQGVEVVVHQYGELVFKRCDDVEKMKEIAEKIYAAGLAGSS